MILPLGRRSQPSRRATARCSDRLARPRLMTVDPTVTSRVATTSEEPKVCHRTPAADAAKPAHTTAGTKVSATTPSDSEQGNGAESCRARERCRTAASRCSCVRPGAAGRDPPPPLWVAGVRAARPDPAYRGRVRAPRRRCGCMAVHAHPDDESSKGAASTARYVSRGRRGARGDLHRRRAGRRAQPQAGRRPGRAGRPRRGSPPGDGARRARSSACSTRGSASSTPATPRATRARPLPEGCFADQPLEVATAAARRDRPRRSART